MLNSRRKDPKGCSSSAAFRKGSIGRKTLISPFFAVLRRGRIYFPHEPEAQCVGKGMEHKKYEFGNKVSIIRSGSGIIPGIKSFRNEYDGHAIEESLSKVKVERITGRKIKRLTGYRGYRGEKEINGT